MTDTKLETKPLANNTSEADAAMELAEDSRQKQWSFPSFAAGLFNGKFGWNHISPFNKQTIEDKKIGDDFIEKIKEVLLKYIDPEKVDKTKKIPAKALDELRKIGCFGMKIPTEHGGLGLSNTNYTRAISFISSYCCSTAVLLSAHQSIGVPQPLKMYGTEEQKKKYFPRLAAGEMSAFALTEPGVGSDPAKMTTTAELSEDGNHYIINGTKLWCTNGPEAKIMIIMATTKPIIKNSKEIKQISAFIFESDTPGFFVDHRCEFMGLKGIINGVLRFENMKIPAENLISKEGDGLRIALATLNSGRLAIPVCSAAAGKMCLSFSQKWANERVQWGRKIGEHQAVSKILSNMTADTFAMHCISQLSTSLADNPQIDIRLEAAIAKYYCSELACKIADDCLQVKGGRGYETSESLRNRGETPDPIERIIRDLRINRIIEGSSEIMRLFIAREAVDKHFGLAMPFLKSKSAKDKFKAFLKLASFYSTWLPAKYMPRIRNYKTRYLNSENKSNLKFISRNARKLARSIFGSMIMYQVKLQDEQVLLGHYVDIGVKLYAMSAVLTVGDDLLANSQHKNELQNLIFEYCNKTKSEIRLHFILANKNKKIMKSKLKLSRDFLNGSLDMFIDQDILKQ
ncbi:MAG: acyl-CoA dehydrogenase family protein [Marinifilaceae bacterium]|jgi:alkylation response protein AidB-like acyl-CoA dehydrogenase|nr:acyl-CoA dehydrogenase family protein [Marinifilaceae bacterium]